MKYLFLCLIFVLGCNQKKDDESKENSSDPMLGEWIYESQGGTSTKGTGMALKIGADGTFSALSLMVTSDGTTNNIYFRKNVGTFTKSGNLFSVKYTYETCNPVGQEELFLQMSGDKLLVTTKDKSFSFTMKRPESSDGSPYSAALEDKNCNILSKVVQKSRVPASGDSGIMQVMKLLK